MQLLQQPIVEEMPGFGSAIDVWKFLTRQAAPEFMIEEYSLRTVEILQVKNRATQQCGEKFEFCNAVAVEVSEPRYRLAHDRVQIVIGYVPVLPIEPVFV